VYYIIKSARLGEVGTEYLPKPGTNVPALLWGGFIAEVNDTEQATDEVSTPAPKKGAKNKKATHKE
jgi:hypothetical protein